MGFTIGSVNPQWGISIKHIKVQSKRYYICGKVLVLKILCVVLVLCLNKCFIRFYEKY